MITTEELRHVYLEPTGPNAFRVSWPRSPEDWPHRRALALEVLKNTIPQALLDLVLLNLKEQTPVRLQLRRESEQSWKFEVEIVDKQIDPNGEFTKINRELGDPMPARMAWELEGLMPASEALACLLLLQLRRLKFAERRESAKARSNPDLIPRSTIADVALDLLHRSEWRYPSGECVVALVRDLLNLENPKQRQSRQPEAQENAVKTLAANPELGVGELARTVGVDKSTVSRWMERPDFQSRVKEETAKLQGS
jgi:hypothetical protein